MAEDINIPENGKQNPANRRTLGIHKKHEIWVFPEDIGNDEFKDWMRFGIVQFTGIVNKDKNVFLKQHSNTPITSSTNIKQGPFLRSQQFNKNPFKKIARADRKDLEGDRRGKSWGVSTDIILPMPNQIVVNNNITWDNAQLGFIGGILKGGINPNDFVTSANDLAKHTGLGNLASTIGTVIKEKLANFAVSITGANGEVVNETFNRFILNPHAEVMFKGVDFRKFQFQWKLTPRSENEVIKIVNIIKLFKFHAAPDITSKVESQNFIIYPSEFQIAFIHKNEDKNKADFNPFLPRIAQCVCTDVTTNYTSVGLWSAFKNGAPVEVDLSLSFSETILITKDKIEEGF